MANRLIRYVGNKPSKVDNANNPSSGVVWSGKDDVQEVDEKFVPALLVHPTVWIEVTQGQGRAAGLSSAKTSGETTGPSPVTTSPLPVATTSLNEFSDDKPTAIKQAIAMLDKANSKHFTGAGQPQVKAIEELLGYDISSQERDAAWAEIGAGG